MSIFVGKFLYIKDLIIQQKDTFFHKEFSRKINCKN